MCQIRLNYKSSSSAILAWNQKREKNIISYFTHISLPISVKHTRHPMTVRWLTERNGKIMGDIPRWRNPRTKTIHGKHFWWIIVLNDFTHSLDSLFVGISAIYDFGNVMQRVWICRIPIWCGKVDSKAAMNLGPTTNILEKREYLRDFRRFYINDAALLFLWK